MDDEGIDVAWLVKRLIVAKLLKGRSAPDVVQVEAEVERARSTGKVVWSSMVPDIVRRVIGAGHDDLIDDYAEQLDTQLDAVSGKAFKDGYVASLNSGVDRSLSWARVSEAWGLDGAQMRSFIGTFPREGYHTEVIPQASRAQLETMLNTRADRIKTNEEYALSQLAQQTNWIGLMQGGAVPPDARKKWHTASDERVCKVCGPMHDQIVPVNSRFRSGKEKFFAPPIHPACRCWVELDYQSVVTKSAVMMLDRPAGDTYHRDTSGQFARVDTLGYQPRQPKKVIAPTEKYTRPLSAQEMRQIQTQVSGGGRGTYVSHSSIITLDHDSDEPAVEQLRKQVYVHLNLPETIDVIEPEPNVLIEQKVEEVSHIIYDSKTRAGSKPRVRMMPHSVKIKDPSPAAETTKTKTHHVRSAPIQSEADVVFVILPRDMQDKMRAGVVVDFSQFIAEGFDPSLHSLDEMGYKGTGQIAMIHGATWHEAAVDEGIGVMTGQYSIMESMNLSEEMSRKIGTMDGAEVLVLNNQGLDAKGLSIKGSKRQTPLQNMDINEETDSTGRPASGYEHEDWKPEPQTSADKKLYAPHSDDYVTDETGRASRRADKESADADKLFKEYLDAGLISQKEYTELTGGFSQKGWNRKLSKRY